MQLAHIITGPDLTAQAEQALELITALNSRGAGNTLICERESVVAIAATAKGIDVVHAPDSQLSALRRIVRLRRLIRTIRPALVHVHKGNATTAVSGLGAWLAAVPVVLSTDYPARRNPLFRKLGQAMFTRILTRSERVGEILEESGLPEYKHSQVRTGIDPDGCRPNWPVEKFRREFDLDDSHIVIGMIAEFENSQGHRDLIKALPRIFAAYSRTRVILIGEGSLENQLRKAVEALGLEAMVSFAGRRPDLRSFLGHFHMLVDLSKDPCRSIHLMEAQSVGVPVVAFDYPGTAEAVADGGIGNLVEPQDHVALATIIQRLMYRPEKRKALARTARNWARHQFALPAMIESYIEAYRAALGSPKRAARTSPETA